MGQYSGATAQPGPCQSDHDDALRPPGPRSPARGGQTQPLVCVDTWLTPGTKKAPVLLQGLVFFGGSCEIRTRDQRIKSGVLTHCAPWLHSACLCASQACCAWFAALMSKTPAHFHHETAKPLDSFIGVEGLCHFACTSTMKERQDSNLRGHLDGPCSPLRALHPLSRSGTLLWEVLRSVNRPARWATL